MPPPEAGSSHCAPPSAPRGRELLRQLLIESLLLSLAGGVVGLTVAYAGLRLIRSAANDWFPLVEQLAIDPVVLGFTLAASLLTGLVFGLLPALQSSRTEPADSLRESGLASTHGRGQARLSSTLVVAEVTIAVIVVVGAGLLLRSLWRLQAVDPGFETRQKVAARISLGDADYPEAADRILMFDRLIERLAGTPGVTAVAAISRLPMGGDFSISFDVVGRPEPDQNLSSQLRMIDPGYFDVMGISLLAGRGFAPTDDRSGADVVLRQGLALAGTGVVVGTLGGLGFGQVLRGSLFGIQAYDPMTLVGVAAFLLIVATAACYIPARRATRVDPAVALRAE